MNRITELDEYVVRPEMAIRQVLERFNVLKHPCQVIIDEAGRPVGAVTDGDARRAILRGVNIDDPVSQCMNRNPMIGHADDDRERSRLLEKLPFVPVVDESGVLTAIDFPSLPGQGIKSALVMAGGAGTRLGELTKTTPKPLLPVGGRPILEHILEKLEAAHVNALYISILYLGHLIEDYIKQRRGDVPVKLLIESDPLGTAGALALLPERLTQPILVINGDILTNTNLEALDAFHRKHSYDATIAVAQYPVQIPFGVVKHDQDGNFLEVEEKPEMTHFVAAGIYYLSPEIVNLVTPGTPVDMPTLLDQARHIGLRVGLFPILEYWTDVGAPHDLDTANQYHSN